MVESILAIFPDASIHSSYARVRCPYHKGGNEVKPSMGILLERKGGMEAGTCHCFTCGKIVSLEELIRDLGKEKIVPKVTKKKEQVELTPLQVDSGIYKPQVPYRFSKYLASRGISEETQKLFKVYEKDDKVYMPVFDKDGRFLYSNTRSIKTKFFGVQENAVKTLWGIEMIDLSKPIAVCESQIDAMSLWEIGIQAVATLGADNTTVLRMIEKSTSTIILAFDQDEAGRRATKNATKMLGIWRCKYLNLPQGIDVNQALQDIGDKDKFKNFILKRTEKASSIVQ